MICTIEIDQHIIDEQIGKILNKALNTELLRKYTQTGDEISKAVKDLVYSRKDEIIDRIVDKAVKELVRKGLPKLLERMDAE